MIDTRKYEMILNEGLLLDHYMLLVNIRDNKESIGSKRIQGFSNLMHKKGYISNNILTDKANALLAGEPIREEVEVEIDVKVAEPQEIKFDYAGWVIQLHRKCEDSLFKATGKKQVRDKIEGKPYSFLPNSTDLGKTILRTIQTYKLRDFDKIEQTILKYIDTCIKANKWFPILIYYIMKNGMSPMVTDMSNTEEDNIQDTTVNI